MALLVLAAWALRRELAGLDAGDVMRQLAHDGAGRVMLGLAATTMSFLLLGGIEVLALRYAGRADIPVRLGLATGFVAHALSQSIGVALLTGASVRVQGYRRHAVSAAEVARMTGFVTLTVTLGLLATGAAAFVASSAPLRLGHLSLPVRPVGVALGLVVLAYVAWCTKGSRGPVGAGRWRIARPAPGVALAQLLLSSLDWVVTGSILWLALPASAAVGYATMLRVYLVAQTIGSLSHVPGGAGVFELLVLALLAPVTSGAQRGAVVAALVLFRATYYLAPLVVASVVAGVSALRVHRVRPAEVVAHAG